MVVARIMMGDGIIIMKKKGKKKKTKPNQKHIDRIVSNIDEKRSGGRQGK